MPLTRTRTGRTVPAGPAGGEKVNEVPDGSTLTSPVPGLPRTRAAGQRDGAASTSVAPGTKPLPVTVNGADPVSTGPPAGGST